MRHGHHPRRTIIVPVMQTLDNVPAYADDVTSRAKASNTST